MKKKRGPGYGSLAIFMMIADVTIIGGLFFNGVPMQQIGSFLFVVGVCATFGYLVF